MIVVHFLRLYKETSRTMRYNRLQQQHNEVFCMVFRQARSEEIQQLFEEAYPVWRSVTMCLRENSSTVRYVPYRSTSDACTWSIHENLQNQIVDSRV